MSNLPKTLQGSHQKRTLAQQAADLVIIETMALRGHKQQDIADHLASIRPYQLTRQMVAYELKKLERQWKAEAAKTVESAKAKAIQALEEQRRELWAAWEKSKTDATTKTDERVNGGAVAGSGATKKRVTVEDQSGNPAFQRLILDIEERLAKLRGLDMPAGIAVGGVPNNPVVFRVEGIKTEDMPR